MSEVLGSPIFTVTYNGKDISKDVAHYLIRLTFTDTVEGEASDVSILMEDVDAKWKNDWYPTKGATLKVDIGGMDCGEFIIDEVVLAGKPDTIEIKGQSSLSDVPKMTTAERALVAGVKKKVRTKKTKAHKNKTLYQIAQTTAQHNGLTIQGSIPNINLGRVNQHNETDLRFLRRISADYGVIFRVQNKKLCVYLLKEIEAKGPALILDKVDLTKYSIKDKTFETYGKVKVMGHHQRLKGVKLATVDVNNKDAITYPQISGGDTYVVHRYVQDDKNALEIAKQLLYRKNSETQTGTINLPGRTSLIAGNNCGLTGLGSAASGTYNMRKVVHTVDGPSSWVCAVDIKRVSGVGPDTPTEPKIEQQPAKVSKADITNAANEYKWTGAQNLVR